MDHGIGQHRTALEQDVRVAAIHQDVALQRRVGGVQGDLLALDDGRHAAAGDGDGARVQQHAVVLHPTGARGDAGILDREGVAAAAGQQAGAVLGADLGAVPQRDRVVDAAAVV